MARWPSSSAGAGRSPRWPSSAWSWSCSTACSSATRSWTPTASTTSPRASRCRTPGERAKLRTLFSTPSVIAAYVGSGLQLFIAGSLFAWLPSYLGRAYGLAPDKAAGIAAIAILFMGVGMIVCGAVTDRLARTVAIRKWTTAIVYTAASLVFLGIGFSLPHGGVQLLLLAIGIFFAAGTAGPAGAMVANLTHESIRATALGTLSLANNLLGLAAGSLITGILADKFGLVDAMKIVPIVAVGALIALLIGRKYYAAQPRQGQRSGGHPMSDATVVLVPGLRGHVEDHWQTRLAATAAGRADGPAARPDRTQPAGPGDAARPDRRGRRRARWSSSPTAPASWSPCTGRRSTAATRVVGALLATPPAFAAELPPEYPSIARAPRPRLAADPAAAAAVPEHRRGRAPTTRWATRCGCGPWRTPGGAGCTSLGAVGHLNPASGFGEWPRGGRR